MKQTKSQVVVLTERFLAAAYGIILASFIALQPWGSIDTRDFSYMGDTKFWIYNAYISAVLLAMLVLGIRLWLGRAGLRTYAWMAVANTAFMVMCLFDLLHFFPDPPQPLPVGVWVIEVVDSVIALTMIFLIAKLPWKGTS